MLEIDASRSATEAFAGQAANATQRSVEQPSGLVAAAMSEEERRHMIAEAAYYRAEHRGFAAGAELDDWLQAEQEIAQQEKTAAIA